MLISGECIILYIYLHINAFNRNFDWLCVVCNYKYVHITIFNRVVGDVMCVLQMCTYLQFNTLDQGSPKCGPVYH